MVPTAFLGGGPDRGILLLNPAFLIDSLKTVPDVQVVLDVEPIMSSKSGELVCPRASLVYGGGGRRVRWVVMPLTIE